jgi:diguanylate cyclase
MSDYLAQSNMQVPPAHKSSALEHVARPLLRLVQHISGMETSFVTSIDWDSQTQDVLYSLNTGEMQVPEGSRIDWCDSMCRSMFLAGCSHTSAVGVEVPSTAGAIALKMTSFFHLPIMVGDTPIGTVCGASRRPIALSDAQIEGMQLIADALQQLVASNRAKIRANARAERAERQARDSRKDSDRHATESQQMEHLANTDILTSLPNRRAFTARWEDELARSGRRGYPIGLMLIDADHFKTVNDTMGHLMGDSVLRAIGGTLLAVAKTPDVVARLGGDEFALVITHTDARHLLVVAENIRQIFAAAAVELGVNTTLSIGTVSSEVCPRHELIAYADQALYRSKAAGGDRAELFTCGVVPPAPLTG